MSWSWNETRDKKSYETKGSVTISTEEYRDLIEDVAQLQAAGQKEHDDWYKEYNRANCLETKVKQLEKQWSTFQDFLADHLTVKEDWENFSNKRRLEELDDE